MASAGQNAWVNSVTAVSTTVAATLLLGFLGTVKDIAAQAPLIEAHMKQTSAELLSIKDKQVEHSLVLATMAKDYTSRENLRVEIDKLDSKIRELQMQQAAMRRNVEARAVQ